MLRIFAAFMAAFFMASCGQSVMLSKEKAEFARQEIEKIAREYAPLADEAFTDESLEMQTKRAALRAKLYTIVELVLQDVKVTDTSGLWESLGKALLLVMGAVQ